MRLSLRIAIPIVFLILGITYAFVVPLWEAPDEPAHYLEVLFRARSMGFDYYGTATDDFQFGYYPLYEPLPKNLNNRPRVANLKNQRVASPLRGPGIDRPGEIYHQYRPSYRMWSRETIVRRYEHEQPPTYYYLSAALLSPLGTGPTPIFVNHQFPRRGKNLFWHQRDLDPVHHEARRAVLFLRIVNSVFGTLTLLVIIAIGRLAYPRDAWSGSAGAILAGFLPQFLFLHGTINNGPLANLLSAVAFLSFFRLAGSNATKWKGSFYALLTGGLALLGAAIKFSAIYLFAAVILGFCILAIYRLSLKFLLWAGCASLPAVIALAVIYLNPYSRAGLSGILKSRIQTFFSGNAAGFVGGTDAGIHRLFDSLTGRFGWLNVEIPTILSFLILGLAFLGLTGGVVRFLRSRSSEGSVRKSIPSSLILFCAILLGFFVVYRHGMITTQFQGRYLFAVIGPLGLLIGRGILGLVRDKAKMVLALLLLLVAVNLHCLFGVIEPAYSIEPPGLIHDVTPEGLPGKILCQFEDGFSRPRQELRGNVYPFARYGTILIFNYTGQALDVDLSLSLRSPSGGSHLVAYHYDLKIAELKVGPGRRTTVVPGVPLRPGENVVGLFRLPREDPGGVGSIEDLRLVPAVLE